MSSVVGYIGLGDIGTPMAERLIAAGYELVVWNRTAAKMRPLLDKGARAAASPADLAGKADIICTCVTNAEALEAVAFGIVGIASGAERVKLVIDSSTIHPDSAREIGRRLRAECGIAFVDAPVSGGAIGARRGTLAAMLGGKNEDVERARPLVETFSDRVTHMGPVGAGQATKACNQIMNGLAVAAVAEAFALAGRLGLDVSRLPDALAGGFADSCILREYGRATKAGEKNSVTVLLDGLIGAYTGDVSQSFRERARISLKDTGIILQLGQEYASPLPLMSVFDTVIRLYREQLPKGAILYDLDPAEEPRS